MLILAFFGNTYESVMISRIEELLKNTKVEWKKLGEIVEIQMCKRILKNQTKNKGDIPFYKI